MGDLITFVLAISLGLVGLAVLAYLTWILAAPCFGWLRGSKELRKLRKGSERIKLFDTAVDRNDLKTAMTELRAAMVYDVPTSLEVVNLYREHFQNILSRVLLVAEESSLRPDGLPDVERLLLERAELLALQSKVLDSFNRLRSKRSTEGKELPTWGRDDFERRLEEVKSELVRNRNNLEDHLKVLFTNLERPHTEEGITYH